MSIINFNVQLQLGLLVFSWSNGCVSLSNFSPVVVVGQEKLTTELLDERERGSFVI